MPHKSMQVNPPVLGNFHLNLSQETAKHTVALDMNFPSVKPMPVCIHSIANHIIVPERVIIN